MDMPDQELLDLYRQGDTGAIGVLVERHRRPLYGFILKSTEGRTDADEIFQETWFRALRRIDSYKHQNFRAWLMRIARNLIIDRARRKKPVASLDAETEDGQTMAESIPGPARAPAEEARDHELGDRIARAVADLPDDQREVFLMRTQADMSFKDVAETQGVSVNTALARMHYAIGKLRAVLQDEYEQLGR
jgi:RNA polymerase sigma-70 factor (ECF subfamily)